VSTVILTTVGTSLLTNAKKALKENPTDQDILNYLQADPQKACAETNSLSRILQAGDEIVLLYSATEEGRKAAHLLHQYFLQANVPCGLVEIGGLAYEARGFVDFGLKNFVRTLAGEIRKAANRQREVIINATGGFKAEISYATVLGLVFKVPVCYIHEQFKEIAILPPTPIGWDSSLFVWYADFFDWLSAGEAGLRPKVEAESRAALLPEEAHVLLEEFEFEGQLYLGLSPLGEAYLEAFKNELEQAQGVPIYLYRQARRELERLEPATQERYHKLLQRLRLPNRTALSEFKSGRGDALGYPKGQVDERLFYAEKDGKLYVFALTRHGPEYEKMCREGFRWSNYSEEDFEPWEG
jgi:putative CRISPR-associated protein (TIGR02619 family)